MITVVVKVREPLAHLRGWGSHGEVRSRLVRWICVTCARRLGMIGSSGKFVDNQPYATRVCCKFCPARQWPVHTGTLMHYFVAAKQHPCLRCCTQRVQKKDANVLAHYVSCE